MERAEFEPAASGLQTHPIARPGLTPTDRIGMAEPKSASPANEARHRSTAVRSHRARMGAAYMGNIRAHGLSFGPTEANQVHPATDSTDEPQPSAPDRGAPPLTVARVKSSPGAWCSSSAWRSGVSRAKLGRRRRQRATLAAAGPFFAYGKEAVACGCVNFTASRISRRRERPAAKRLILSSCSVKRRARLGGFIHEDSYAALNRASAPSHVV
jgi:hypothetical protein